MEVFNLSFNSEENDSEGSRISSLNIVGIKMNNNLLENSIREEYEDKLQEKDDIIDDLRDEVEFRQKREFDAFHKYKNIKDDFDHYKFSTNLKMRTLHNKVNQYEKQNRDYQDLKYRNEDLEDENYDLYNKVRSLQNQNDDNTMRYNQILNQKNAEQNFLINQLNEYQRVHQINANNLMQLSQQNNSLYQQNQRAEEIINLQNSQIIQLKQELAKTKKELEDSKIINNSLNTQLYSVNYNVENNNINDYQNNYSNYNESNKIIIRFKSIDQNIEKEIECHENELFRDVVEKLINQCPQLVGKNLTFLQNGTVLDKSASVKDNKLTNGLIVLINIIDDNIFEYNQENDYVNSNNISYSNYNEISNTNDNYANNENNFSPNQITTATTTSYVPQNDIPYITQTSNSYIENVPNFTTSEEPIHSYENDIGLRPVAAFSTTSAEPLSFVPAISIEPVPQNYNPTTTITTMPISVVPTITTINMNQVEDNNNQVNSNNNSISVVPAVSFYPISQNNDFNQINDNAAPISVVPNFNIINIIPDNNNYTTTTSSNSVSIVPNVIFSPIPISVVPEVSAIQNSENDDF